MYWKPHLAARVRMARARNMKKALSTPTISVSAASTQTYFSSSVTVAIPVRSCRHTASVALGGGIGDGGGCGVTTG